MSKLSGKVAVVTGGNSGIGLASAQAFANEGATVIITGRNVQTLDTAVQTIGAKATAVQVDVTQIDELAQLFANIATKHGKIDVLFVNAGMARLAPFENITETDYDSVMNVNVKGAYFTIQKALPYLNEGASIVLNASINANIGMPMTSIYAASKAAVVSLARTLSAELVGRGIRVNVVSPGPTSTPLFGRLGFSEAELDGFASQVVSQVPLGRFGQPEEIAKAVLFLASDDSSFIVGEELVADGGMSTL